MKINNSLLVTCSSLALLLNGCNSGNSNNTTNNSTRDKTVKSLDQSVINQLKSQPKPSQQLTNNDLTEVNKSAHAYIKDHKESFSGVKELLLDSYISNAQQDFLLLSKKVSGIEIGSFAPVTLGIIKLFEPKADIPGLQSKKVNDPYSQALSQQIIAIYQNRLNTELSNVHKFGMKSGNDYWHPTNGYYGIEYGISKPWYLTNCSEFKCPAPPLVGIEIENQAKQVKEAMSHLDEYKLKAIMYWKDSGDWQEIADTYMIQKNVPLEKRLHILAVLTSALTDAKAAAFDSKYSYWVRRPSMVDPTIKPIITAPSHPSYPSGHSTLSSTAAKILDHFLPENTAEWNRLAEEAGMSRIWAGIHFPMDHQEGIHLGSKIAEKVIENDQVNN